MGRPATTLALEPPMTPDWNAIRLDLLGLDEPMRASLREMRPLFAKAMPGIESKGDLKSISEGQLYMKKEIGRAHV